MEKITLGSASPRRRELIKRLGVDIIVRAPEIDEVIDLNLTPEENGVKIAKDKLNYLKDKFPGDRWIITADTFIDLDGEILGKPKDYKDAYKMLQSLSSRSHRVITSVAIYSKENNITLTESDITTVTFDTLSDDDIKGYLKHNEWVDAAGSYKIQGFGEILVKSINGSFSSVMGLPIFRIYGMLKKLNFIIPGF